MHCVPRSAPDPSTAAPVARVLVDVPAPHLDRPFDYRVPPELDAQARPGVRVRVRFAGRLVGGFVLERTAGTEHVGPLTDLTRVVSDEPVLSGPVARLCRAVADHYAGTMTDVVRLAVPPRHARTEREETTDDALPEVTVPELGEWRDYPAGPGLLDALRCGSHPHAALAVLPGHDWPALLARAALTTAAGGRGAVVVLPDRRDVARVDQALIRLGGAGRHAVLHGELGPTRRYRAFLAALRGRVRIVVGTRSAVFAPVRDLGLLAVWDDGDDLLAEPRAPYPHARDVALLRAHGEGAALLLAGQARTSEAARLVRSGWAAPVGAPRDVVRSAAPRVHAAGDPGEGRVPSTAFRAVRDGLGRGPVLVQVPRRGYWPVVACARCREPARCPRCAGPLQLEQSGDPACRWCGRRVEAWQCASCGSRRLRAVVVGSERTAEELGRAFPGVLVRRSGWGATLDSVDDTACLVVATPGAEPRARGGFAAALLLDGAAMLARPDLRAGEETLRRWLNAAALVRPAGEEGTVVVVAPAGHRAVQALVRWDPEGFSLRELADRESARLPPAARLAELTGAAADVEDLLALATLPAGADVLGPVPHGDDAVRALVRAPLRDGAAATAALRAAAAVRSARRRDGVVRVRVDPVDVG